MIHPHKPTKHQLVAFFTGFSLMAFELVAARILAPTIGSSTYIWTNVIGVIMVALSIGYFLGGKMADTRAKQSDIVLLLLASALLIALVALCSSMLIDFSTWLTSDSRAQGFIVAILLFAPASLVIGMVSPYLAKLSVSSLKKSGSSVAKLSSWNAIGSIVGTFITGFVLFELIGSRQTLAVIVFVLLLATLMLYEKTALRYHLILLLAIFLLTIISLIPAKSDTISIDTAVANYQISYKNTAECYIVSLATGPKGTQSSTCQGDPTKLLFWYTQEMAKVIEQLPRHDRILILGGGAFTMPAYLSEKYPDAVIDVVEIDPELQHIAEQYFGYSQSENTSIFAEDARSFVNRDVDNYDIVLVDVYADSEIPWQLLTDEYGTRIAELAPNGTVIINAIASDNGVCHELFDVIASPYKNHFSHGAYKARYPEASHAQNMILVFANNDFSLDGYYPIPATSKEIFTDNFAPIDAIYERCANAK